MSEPRLRESINCEAELELRRGPWTLEEDTLLIHYIALHGEGRWNLLARSSGLKRTGKSCRLRWLNYLKPDVKRGNLSPQEQFLILELHSKWGNRWSRIAQHLPGRTDNEIKNYWRTRVQKQARQLRIDVNSAMFRDALRCYWIPRLLEKIVSPPPPSLCAADELETHQTLNQAPLCDPDAPELIVPGSLCPPFCSGHLENCSPSMSQGRAGTGGFHIKPDDVEIDSFLNGEHCITYRPYDELELAAEMLASPTEIACFDGSNSVDYGGFSDGLWN